MTRPLHFLVIEDDADHAELIEHALRVQPHVESIVRLPDGVEGLRYLKGEGDYSDRSLPDVVLLDMKLPRKGGLETLREIRADERLAGIPVIMLTTSEAQADMLEAYRSHANSYLVKPVDFARFKSMIAGVSQYWSQLNRRPHNEPAGET